MSKYRCYLALALILVIDLAPPSGTCGTAHGGAPDESAPSRTAFSWFDGRRMVVGWISRDIIMEFGHVSASGLVSRRAYSRARIVEHDPGRRVWKVLRSERMENVLAELSSRFPLNRFSPVWITGESERSGIRAFPGGVLVRFGGSWTVEEAAHWLDQQGVTMLRRLPVEPGKYFLVDSPPGMAALRIAASLSHPEEGITAFPDWWQPRYPK